MAYNHGREDRKWRIWKEAEEKVLREHGVDEAVIEQIRMEDRADFNSNRRFYRWTSDFGKYFGGMADTEQQAGPNTVADLLDEIEDEKLFNAVLADIQRHARLAFEAREKAVALAVKMNAKVEGNRGKNNETKLKQARKRYDEVTRLFDRLYEDSLAGSISNENFTRLIDKCQTEQGKLLEQIATPEDVLQEVKNSKSNAVQWAELMAGYVGITELTAENLNFLVGRIEVSDRTETEDGMQQTVKIC